MTTTFPQELLHLASGFLNTFAGLIESLDFLLPVHLNLNYLPLCIICPLQTHRSTNKHLSRRDPFWNQKRSEEADLFLSSLGEVPSAALHPEANRK